MILYFKCKACGNAHPSMVSMDKESFESATIENEKRECPSTGQKVSFNKEDMFWGEEVQPSTKKEGIPLDGSEKLDGKTRLDGTRVDDNGDDF